MANPPPQEYPLGDLAIGNTVFAGLAGNEPKLAQEDMSSSFVRGLVAQAGLQIGPPTQHDDGVDFWVGCTTALMINGVRRRHPHLYVQLKSVTSPEFQGSGLVFRKLSRERYQMLTDPDSVVPQVLIVYVMPADRSRWTVTCANHVDFVGHAFYLNMRDAPHIGPDDPMKVLIPFTNRLTTCSLIHLFEDAITRHFS